MSEKSVDTDRVNIRSDSDGRCDDTAATRDKGQCPQAPRGCEKACPVHVKKITNIKSI